MAAHSLERRLGALLVARICERALSQSDHATAMATHNRLPLGVLIERFIQEYVPPEDLVEELDNMLYFRNELTHRVSEQVVAACRTAKWEETFIAEMFEITTYFRETNDALRPYTTEWFLKNGLCESEVIEKAITLYPGVRGSDPIPSREP